MSIYTLLKQAIDKLSLEISKVYTYTDNKIALIDVNVTKQDVEAVLTGEITTHTHAQTSSEPGYEQHFLLMGA